MQEKARLIEHLAGSSDLTSDSNRSVNEFFEKNQNHNKSAWQSLSENIADREEMSEGDMSDVKEYRDDWVDDLKGWLKHHYNTGSSVRKLKTRNKLVAIIKPAKSVKIKQGREGSTDETTVAERNIWINKDVIKYGITDSVRSASAKVNSSGEIVFTIDLK